MTSSEYSLAGKRFLITGGSGTIGLALASHLLDKLNPQVVRLLDNNEDALFWAEQELKSYSNVRFLLGDVRDFTRVKMALDGIDIVYHLAAQKHVHLGEQNPTESVHTNILGTVNMLQATWENGKIEKYLFASSDKSLENLGVYGTSKLLAERLTLGYENWKGDRPTAFSVLRPANVFNSSGSVLRVWQRQFADKKPLTVTHPDMMRFFMTIEDLIDFIMAATVYAKGGELFIPRKCSELKIIDLAKELCLLKQSFPDIEVTGLRSGEQLHQAIISEQEKSRAEEHELFWVVK